MTRQVLTVADIDIDSLRNLLARYRLELRIVDDADIPGSFWGDEEAGLIENRLYARADTPIHSVLHESCHYICMDAERRANLHTDAAGDYDEENGVCYLQILLADDLPDMGRLRMMQDMDRWGYTFRLGSAQDWFEQDAEDTRQWLKKYGLAENNQPTYQLRQ